jgi:hypothetical protein
MDVTESSEISVVGQNLLNDDQLEFVPADFVVLQPIETQRGVFVKFIWRY